MPDSMSGGQEREPHTAPFRGPAPTHTDTIALPQSDSEGRFAIRMSDWRRLGRYVARMQAEPRTEHIRVVFPPVRHFGVGDPCTHSPDIGAGLGGVDRPGIVVRAIASFLLGVILACLSKWLTEKRSDRVAELAKETGEIQAGFTSIVP